MKTDKIKYSITRCLDIYTSKSNKYKYKKMLKQMNTFYTEGLKDKDAAIKIRDNIVATYCYNNRSKFSGSIDSSLKLLTSKDFFIQRFYDFCNRYKSIKKMINLE